MEASLSLVFIPLAQVRTAGRAGDQRGPPAPSGGRIRESGEDASTGGLTHAGVSCKTKTTSSKWIDRQFLTQLTQKRLI